MGVIDVFWENVEWHERNKGLTITDVTHLSVKALKEKKANITLKKVQEIADALDIDDYAILFEQMEEEK